MEAKKRETEREKGEGVRDESIDLLTVLVLFFIPVLEGILSCMNV